MARARRKSSGCTSGRFKLKKMGKGMSANRPRLGYRPKPRPKKGTGDTKDTDGSQ